MQDLFGLLLPDFLLIALGAALMHGTAFKRPVWEAAERLVYWVLFPALLFVSIVKSPISPAAAWPLALGGVGVVAVGVALSYGLRWAPGVPPGDHASAAQIGFRFNSYVALALSERLGGAGALAGMSLLVAVTVPLCNLAAVWPLARAGGQGYWGELRRNPLLLSTLGGLLANLAGVQLPEWMSAVLSRVGAAALPLGLMAVGAGLTLGGIRGLPVLRVGLLGVRHLVLPVVGLALALWLPLTPAHAQLLVVYAAMPTASSAYVLAVRMGGNGPLVAGLVTTSTALAWLSLPLALAAWRALA